jgi:hypothetical protein
MDLFPSPGEKVALGTYTETADLSYWSWRQKETQYPECCVLLGILENEQIPGTR